MLIFINGTQSEYHKYINKILNCFNEAGLFLNIKKCKFEVIRIKYLEFIVNVRVGIQMDPEKVKVITEWQFFIMIKSV